MIISSDDELAKDVRLKVAKDSVKPKVTKDAVKPKVPKDAVKPKVPKDAAEPKVPKDAAEPKVPKDAVKSKVPKDAVKSKVPKDAVKPKVPKDAVKPSRDRVLNLPKNLNDVEKVVDSNGHDVAMQGEFTGNCLKNKCAKMLLLFVFFIFLILGNFISPDLYFIFVFYGHLCYLLLYLECFKDILWISCLCLQQRKCQS